MIDALGPGDPTEVSGYVLRGRLGDGGMGSVYLSHTRGGLPVALKVIRREFAQNPEFLRRFTREVEAARRVQGAYTAAVVDSSTDGPQPWLASTFVAGPTLARAVQEHGPLPVGTVLLLVAGVAEALASVHAAGVVHRDLKPSNVLLAADGPRVIDFGIARAMDATALTGTDVRLGTPAFMSPEQATGTAAGPPLDVFALGLIAFYAATGGHPFGEGTGPALLYRIVAQQPDLTACPERLRPLVEHCLAKEPEKRPDLDEVIEECHRIAAAEGTTLVRTEGWWLPTPVADEVTRQLAEPLLPVGAARAGGYVPTTFDDRGAWHQRPTRAAEAPSPKGDGPRRDAARPRRAARTAGAEPRTPERRSRMAARLFGRPFRWLKIAGWVFFLIVFLGWMGVRG